MKKHIAIFSLPGRGKRNEFIPLQEDVNLHAQWVTPEDYWQQFPSGADVIVLPGSAATVTDMQHLRSSGGDKIVLDHVAAGKVVVGICGGYQLLGQKLYNPSKTQGDAVEIDGLGLLPISTLFGETLISTDTRATCLFAPDGLTLVSGEEHRSGYSWRTSRSGKYTHLNVVQQRTSQKDPLPKRTRKLMPGKLWAPGREKFDGLVRRDRLVWGTYIHLIFHNEGFRQAVLG